MNQTLRIAAGVFLGIIMVLVLINLPKVWDKVSGNEATRRQQQENAEYNRRAEDAALQHELAKARLERESEARRK